MKHNLMCTQKKKKQAIFVLSEGKDGLKIQLLLNTVFHMQKIQPQQLKKAPPHDIEALIHHRHDYAPN